MKKKCFLITYTHFLSPSQSRYCIAFGPHESSDYVEREMFVTRIEFVTSSGKEIGHRVELLVCNMCEYLSNFKHSMPNTSRARFQALICLTMGQNMLSSRAFESKSHRIAIQVEEAIVAMMFNEKMRADINIQKIHSQSPRGEERFNFIRTA